MSSIAKHLTKVNKIASGPGAVTLPSTVSYIKLELREAGKFHPKTGNKGATRFWKSYLPQVQFHNPQLPIAVSRFAPGSKDPARLLVKTTDGKEQSIDVTELTSQSILAEFIKATGAQQVPVDQIPVLKEPLLNV